MKHSDRPIVRPCEDILGRAEFSLALARAIDQLVVAKDGFVIAVVGEWGAGKSSAIEMTLRFLTHLEMERESARTKNEAQTLEALESLAEAYDLIRDKVASHNYSNLDFSKTQRSYRLNLFQSWLATAEEADKADRYWILLDSVRYSRRTIQVRFSPWLISGRGELATALMSELARAIGEELGSEAREAFASLLKRLSELAPIAGAGLDFATGSPIGKFLSTGATWSASAATKLTRGPTLDELRENLRTILRRLSDRRILVIVDDLDRLTPHEATEMVSLVKSLGDLPNVIYLLSFDQDNLAKLISEGTGLDGQEYLTKIVQYPVHLPPILRNGLSRVLDADISELLGELDDEAARRIGHTWHFVFRHYLKTPRDIRLYTNALAVSLSSQRDFVDPIDLMLLEVLRLHEPSLYEWIRENLEELTE